MARLNLRWLCLVLEVYCSLAIDQDQDMLRNYKLLAWGLHTLLEVKRLFQALSIAASSERKVIPVV